MEKHNRTSQLLSKARALHQAGNLGEAVPLYEAVLVSEPRNVDVLKSWAIAEFQRNNREVGVRLLDRYLEINPGDPEIYYNRGYALYELHRYDEALASYDKAIALKPAFAMAHNNRGNLLLEMKRYNEALTSLDKAILLMPDLALAHYNRGRAMLETKRYDEAALSYEKALALNPDAPYTLGNLLHSRMHICDWRGIESTFIALTKGIEAGKEVSSPFTLLATSLSGALQKQCAEFVVQNKFPPSATPLWNGEKYSHDRIRIGYFSADFQSHATARLMAELFELHDRSRFEVTAFSFGPPSNDAMRKRLEKAFEHFVDVSAKSDAEISALARSMEIDIAIDLKGFTGDSRTGIFAQRPAPVQVNYLGYPGTMGASYIDYLIADGIVIPEAHRQYYTESIVYLPDSYQVNDSTRKISDKRFTRKEMGLPEKGFIFCCFNNSFKITPDAFDIWMRLLHKVDGSVLWLFEGSTASANNLRAEAQIRGIAENRLIFAKRMDVSDHLARLSLADLFLDTLYCNAHTTASDALWVGLPVLTCLGNTFAGRVAASLLSAANLPEMITHSHAEYEALALELATNRQKLATIRQKLAQNRTACPLFDTQRFTKNLEDRYTMMIVDSNPEKPGV